MTKEQIKEKAKELAINATRSIDDNGKEVYNALVEAALQDMAEWLLDNMWISVEDELPPFEKCVIVHYDNGGCRYGEMFSHRTEDDYVIKDKYDFCNYFYEKITHWMQIPKLNEK